LRVGERVLGVIWVLGVWGTESTCVDAQVEVFQAIFLNPSYLIST
jgi:hypothetical protein